MDIALSMVVAVAEVPRVAAVVPYMVGMAVARYSAQVVAEAAEWGVATVVAAVLGAAIRSQPGHR